MLLGPEVPGTGDEAATRRQDAARQEHVPVRARSWIQTPRDLRGLSGSQSQIEGAEQTGSGAVLRSERGFPPDFRVTIARRSQKKAGEAEVGRCPWRWLEGEAGGREPRGRGRGSVVLTESGVGRHAVPEDALEKMFPRRRGEEESFFVLLGNVNAG